MKDLGGLASWRLCVLLRLNAKSPGRKDAEEGFSRYILAAWRLRAFAFFFGRTPGRLDTGTPRRVLHDTSWRPGDVGDLC